MTAARPVRAEEALALFEAVALPVLGRAFALNTCIEQTRILIDVLAGFGIAAEPLATKLHLVCEEKGFQFFISGDDADLRSARRNPTGFRARPNREGETLGYHTVALVERRLMVDLTLAQASAPEYAFHIEPQMVMVDFHEQLPPDHLPDVKMSGATDDGIEFTVRWIGVPARDWESAPGWEPSHLVNLIGGLQFAMKAHRAMQPEVV